MVGDCDSRSTGLQAIIGYSLTVAALAVLATKGQLFGSGLISVTLQGVAVLIVAWARAALGRRSFHVGARPSLGSLVAHGPYSLVRNPIYGGTLLFFLGALWTHRTSLAAGAFACALIGVWLRISAEERALTAHYGEEYGLYTRRVPKLIPRLRALQAGPTFSFPGSRGVRSWATVILVAITVGLAAGCTQMVMDRYRDGVMMPSLYFWVADYEQPEIIVSWAHYDPSPPERGLTNVEHPAHPLAIEPGLQGCQAVQVFVNSEAQRIGDEVNAIEVSALPLSDPIIPDERYPDCSVLLTFRTAGSPPTFVISAATKNGVVKEFPNGKRQPAWLLLLPLAAVPDAALALITVAGVLLMFAR